MQLHIDLLDNDHSNEIKGLELRGAEGENLLYVTKIAITGRSVWFGSNEIRG